MKQVVVGVIAALVCGVGTAHAERYVIPTVGTDTAHVIDLDTLRRKGPVARYWTYGMWRQPATVPGSTKQFNEVRSLHEVNCDTEEHRLVQYSFYLRQALVEASGPTGNGWAAVTPRTVVSLMFRNVCSDLDPDLTVFEDMRTVEAVIDSTWKARDASR